jgi:hypothetical protein
LLFAGSRKTNLPAGKKEKTRMTTKKLIGAALLALAILPAAVFVFHLSIASAFMLAMCGAPLVFGTATISYASFQDGSGPHGGYTGGTTAPTQGQSYTVNAVVAKVTMGDTDVSAAIVHNLGLSTAQLAALQPYITINTDGASVNTVSPILKFTRTDGNTVTMAKDSNTGNGGTYIVTVRRPWSPSQ